MCICIALRFIESNKCVCIHRRLILTRSTIAKINCYNYIESWSVINDCLDTFHLVTQWTAIISEQFLIRWIIINPRYRYLSEGTLSTVNNAENVELLVALLYSHLFGMRRCTCISTLNLCIAGVSLDF